MKLKLTYGEIQCLCGLLQAAMQKYSRVMNEMHRDDRRASLVPFGLIQGIPEDEQLETMLYRSIFEEMWIKFQKRSFEYREKFSIELKPHQAIAFHIEFSGIVDETDYCGNVAQRLCNQIHQKIQQPQWNLSTPIKKSLEI